ncbi:MAG: uracil-DNA glycosylase [Flavobacteriales bacterium]|nr:uracil-DNA glycosylase [Flavobacteriales bacterium]
MPVKVKINDEWARILLTEFESDYFKNLKEFLIEEKKHHQIFPPGSKIFEAFNTTPFSKVRLVIIGQDPYHGLNQANGLCFSVNRSMPIPPSLVNIFKELKSDLGIEIPKHGDLSSWAQQGVLMLNSVLTVRSGEAGSHRNKGWERFTDQIIKQLSNQNDHLVFFLWGNYARSKKELIDPVRHLILESSHPSPLSAHSGFLGSKPFSKANDYFRSNKLNEINWKPD